MKNKIGWMRRILVILIILLIAAAIYFFVLPVVRQKNQPEVITVSTLQKIINVSELSTYTAVYNGVAQVMNEENPDEIDYYVSYEAKVYAGIDFEKINISIDHEEKVIRLEIPEISITDVTVDISSMDFIFYNEKANEAAVSQDAYRACEEDAKRESQNQKDIYLLAKQNAGNVLTALIAPLVDQMNGDYQLIVV